jgi:uncharacterized phage protein (TIGR02220 family)
MRKPTKRKAFSFLRSYFDILNELENDKDKLSFLLSVINKQFLDQDPKDLNFVVNLCYESQRHIIEKSVKGYKDKTKKDLLGNPLDSSSYTSTQDPCQGGTEGGCQDPCQDPYQQEKEKEKEKEEEVINIPPLKKDDNVFDFKKLLGFINLKTQRSGKNKFKVINKTVKAKFKARLKDGYSKEDISNTISNAVKDKFHIDNNFKYLTPEYFSRQTTIDKFAFKNSKTSKHIPKDKFISNPYD